MSAPSVLYDAPGPRARRLNAIGSVVALAALLALAWFVYAQLDANGQWAGEKWSPFLKGSTWTTYLVPGLLSTLRAAAVAAVAALLFGFVFGIGRMSTSGPVRWISGTVVEFFRSIPLLILIIFAFYGAYGMFGQSLSAFTCVVIGLTLYNGSVLAEIVRAGIQSLPRGQSEAAQAIGLTYGQSMRLVLLPQGVRAMLPAIVAQLVVLLKDTALGYIIGYDEALNQVSKISANYGNVIQASIVVAALFLAINLMLSWFAHWLERRLSRSTTRTADPEAAAAAAAAGVNVGQL
jgi:glutamate transport system permease protein